MNLEKFTDRAKGFLQAAQTVAIRNSHQRIAPEHLLKALIEDDQGMASGLIQAAGGDAKRVERETDAALAKIPAVSARARSRRPASTMIWSACSTRPNRSRKRRATASSPSSGCCSRSRWPRPMRRARRWRRAG